MKVDSINSISSIKNIGSATYLEPQVNREVLQNNQNKEKLQTEYSDEFKIKITDEEFKKLVEEINQKVFGPECYLQFSVYDKMNEIIVRVVNKETKEVIREIPKEKILDMIVSMCEMVGLFVDKKA